MPAPWKTLGLDGPTKDLKAIKRAYAAKLKVTRPEDDPEAFMALRDALDEAMQYIRFFEGQSADNTPHPLPHSTTKANKDSANLLTSQSAVSNAVNSIYRVSEIIKNPTRSSDESAWAKIFDDKSIEVFDDWIEFDHRLREYFLDIFGAYEEDEERYNINLNPRPIPEAIGKYIFERMDWLENASRGSDISNKLNWLKKDFGLPGPVQYYPARIRKYPDHYRRPKPPTLKDFLRNTAYIVLSIIVVSIVAYFVGVWANARPPY